jgi:c-di-GMP-binding flagellar brake protein YcgR
MSFLKKIFSKAIFTSAQSPAVTALNPASEQPPKLPQEYRVLGDLQKKRQLLEVKIGTAARAYQSMVIALDVERNLLWLDDLFPQQVLLEVGDEITLKHHYQGEELRIKSQVLALGNQYGATGIAIMLPANAQYTPRRKHSRFNLAFPLTVKIRSLGEEPCFGSLEDISLGGLRLHVAGNLLTQLTHGAILPLCEISLSKELQLRCRARVCAFRISRKPYRSTQISIEFLELSKEKQMELKFFLHQQFHATHYQQDNCAA